MNDNRLKDLEKLFAFYKEAASVLDPKELHCFNLAFICAVLPCLICLAKNIEDIK